MAISEVLAALYSGDRERALASARGQELTAFEAAALGDGDALRRALARRPEWAREFSEDGFTALHLAAFFAAEREVLTTLVEAGADVDAEARNAMRVHPLNSAAAGGNVEAVELLLDRGAQVDVPQGGGYTALHSAASNGNLALVRRLVERGADRSAISDDGRTPADIARERGHVAVADDLATEPGLRPAPPSGQNREPLA